jgi:hypothetical protein
MILKERENPGALFESREFILIFVFKRHLVSTMPYDITAISPITMACFGQVFESKSRIHGATRL